jgi:hypothetical protein
MRKRRSRSAAAPQEALLDLERLTYAGVDCRVVARLADGSVKIRPVSGGAWSVTLGAAAYRRLSRSGAA